jgi:Family of unknown function (DUF6882)
VQALTLANVLDDAAILSLEHQAHLEEILGDHDWNVDFQQQRFVFTGSRTIACTGFHLIGTAAPDPGSWLWGWSNPSGLPEPLTALSATVRDFGQQHRIAELAAEEIPFNALPGSPADPALVARMLTDAAKPITGRWTSYIGDAGGTQAAFIIEHPDFQLPPPELARVMRVLQQALMELPLSDHRRALHSYATRRQLGAAFSPDHAKLNITGPGFTVIVDFDQHNRVANINASTLPG